MRWLALASLLASQAALADTLSGAVVKVLDGDTLVIADVAKKRHTVRLAGIDAPERNQPFWLEAKRSLAAREFALGVEALERFVREEPLRREVRDGALSVASVADRTTPDPFKASARSAAPA